MACSETGGGSAGGKLFGKRPVGYATEGLGECDNDSERSNWPLSLA